MLLLSLSTLGFSLLSSILFPYLFALYPGHITLLPNFWITTIQTGTILLSSLLSYHCVGFPIGLWFLHYPHSCLATHTFILWYLDVSLCRLTLYIFYARVLIIYMVYLFDSNKCLRLQLVMIRTPECHTCYLYLSYPWVPVLPKVEGTPGTSGSKVPLYPQLSYLMGNSPLGSGKDFGFSRGTTTCR